MAANPVKAAAAATLSILQGDISGQGGVDSSARAIQAALAQKPQQSTQPVKKKVKKVKTTTGKAFAEFKRDVVSRLTRIEQLLEQQAIMLRYPAPIYPHMVPPPPNGTAPPPPYSQPPPPRGQAYPPLPPAPAPTPPYPQNPPSYPPPSAPPPTNSQAPAPAISSAHPPGWQKSSGGVEEGDQKRRRLFAGHDLRDHRKVSNKRGGRGTRKTCRKCSAEGHENVLLVGHKCPYVESKKGGEKAGEKRALDGSLLNRAHPPRPEPPLPSVQNLMPPPKSVVPPRNALPPPSVLLVQSAPRPLSIAPPQSAPLTLNMAPPQTAPPKPSMPLPQNVFPLQSAPPPQIKAPPPVVPLAPPQTAPLKPSMPSPQNVFPLQSAPPPQIKPPPPGVPPHQKAPKGQPMLVGKVESGETGKGEPLEASGEGTAKGVAPK